MVKTVNSNEVRDNLNNILTQAANEHHSFIIEQEGDLLAAIIPYDVFERWQEVLEDLEDSRDAAIVDRLFREEPEAFLSLEEFNTALDTAEAAGKLPA